MNFAGKQIFSVLLDNQIKTMIYQLLNKSIGEEFSSNLDYFKSEIVSVIDGVYHFCSKNNNAASHSSSSLSTPGMKVTGLDWSQEGDPLLYILLVIVQIVSSRLRSLSLLEGWKDSEEALKRHFAELIRWSLFLAKSLSLVNFMVFCMSGDYPTLLHRLAGFRMKATSSTASTDVIKTSQLFMEQRKFLWLSMIGLASTAMISIDWQYLKFYLFFLCRQVMKTMIRWNRQWQRRWTTRSATREEHKEEAEEKEIEESGISTDLASSSLSSSLLRCAVCNASSPENVHVSNCGHRFCYLCLYPLLPRNPGSKQAEQKEEDEEEEEIDERHHCPSCMKVLITASPAVE